MNYWPLLGILLVVLGFAALGFAWWEAYPVLHERYWAGLASSRPSWYWVFGNLAALVLVAGPMLAAGLGAGWPRLRALVSRERPDPVAALVAAGLVMVAVADLSLMSKAEVERIWDMAESLGENLRRSGVCGPEVPVPADAPLQDRLLGALGRDPS